MKKPLSKSEAETLLSSRNQIHLTNAAFTVAALSNPGNKIPLRGLYFRAPAGTGKSTAARFVADIAGAEFWEIPAGIKLPELIGGNEEKGFKGLSHILNYERSSESKVLYFEEFGQVDRQVRTFILDLADVAKESAGDTWGVVREKTLICLGTNEGIANEAIAGPSGRFLDIPLECLSSAEKAAKVDKLLSDYGCKASKGAREAILFFSPCTHRGVENLVYRLAAGESELTAVQALERIRPSDKREAIAGPLGMSPIVASILKTMVRASEPLRLATLQSECGAGQMQPAAWRAALATARSFKWMKAVSNGVIATETARESAKAFSAKVEAIRAMDAAPAKVKATRVASKGKGGKV